jgi:hypothetical protein
MQSSCPVCVGHNPGGIACIKKARLGFFVNCGLKKLIAVFWAVRQMLPLHVQNVLYGRHRKKVCFVNDRNGR